MEAEFYVVFTERGLIVEAEAYSPSGCPQVGMKMTIQGQRYVVEDVDYCDDPNATLTRRKHLVANVFVRRLTDD